MNVTQVSVLACIFALLLPSNASHGPRCAAEGVVGCGCNGRYDLWCFDRYAGTSLPVFGGSNNTYDTISFGRTGITVIQPFILLNTKTVSLFISGRDIVSIHPKAFWTGESNSTTSHTELVNFSLIRTSIMFIKSGTFDPLINLDFLNLGSNKLCYVDSKLIINLRKLSQLSIVNNELTQLPTKWLPSNLKFLYMYGNEIEYASKHTFEGAFNLFMIQLDNIAMDYDTFSNLTKVTSFKVFPHRLCTCKYVWYLNTLSTSRVCDDYYTEYAGIRQYLNAECKEDMVNTPDTYSRSNCSHFCPLEV